MRANRAKATMTAGGRVLNAWCSIPSSYIAEALAHAGFDSVTVDLQHGALDYAAAFSMLQAISTSDATPLVRVPWNEPGILMKVLDAGAYGVICPMINTRRDAEPSSAPAAMRQTGIGPMGRTASSNTQAPTIPRTPTAKSCCWRRSRRWKPPATSTKSSPSPASTASMSAGRSVALDGRASHMAPKDERVLAAMAEIRTRARAKGLLAAVHTDGAETALVRFAKATVSARCRPTCAS